MKIKTFVYINLSLLIILLTACGGGSDDSEISQDNPVTNIRSIEMIIGKSYTVSENQTIVKEANNTLVEIESDINTKKTTAILKSGKARIEYVK
jgi:hypothetical protein